MTTHSLTKFSRITLDWQPPVARIVLNNPPLNVIDIPMMDELAEALTEIEARIDISSSDYSRVSKSLLRRSRRCCPHSRQS